MGMYDNVNYKADCFNCGEPLSGFQTKDTDCSLSTVQPEECTDQGFYTDCHKCHAWNEYIAEPMKVNIRLKRQDELNFYQRLEEKLN